MKVMIDIPKEFERDLQNKFNEFFERVKVDLRDYPSQDKLCGNYEMETVEMFLSAFEKATIIPDDATNGDVVKLTFPSEEKELNMSKSHLMYNGLDYVKEFRKAWWNAPYKAESEE